MRAVIFGNSVCSCHIDGADFLVSAIDSRGVAVVAITRRAHLALQDHSLFNWTRASYEFCESWVFFFHTNNRREMSSSTEKKVIRLLAEKIPKIEFVHAK
jgi:hypothetical protein